MLRTVARWQYDRLVRRSPGTSGLLALFVFPLLLLVPWQRLGLFDASLEAALLLNTLYAFMVASNVASDSGEFSNSAFWLFQKGISLADYALAKWSVALGFGVGFVILGGVASSAGIGLYADLTARQAVVCLALPIFLFLIAQAMYHLLGAAGVGRKSELLFVIVLMGAAQGMLFHRLAPSVRHAIHFILPPVQDAYAGASAIANAAWIDAVRNTSHVVGFLVCCLTLAFVLHRRWTPGVGESRSR